jgi:hypothetical protein
VIFLTLKGKVTNAPTLGMSKNTTTQSITPHETGKTLIERKVYDYNEQHPPFVHILE